MSEKTIGTYKTKGFTHEGVSGTEGIDRLSENGAKGITTQVMKENNVAISKKVAKDTVKTLAVGNGVDSQKPVDKLKGKGKSAGMIGASNANVA